MTSILDAVYGVLLLGGWLLVPVMAAALSGALISVLLTRTLGLQDPTLFALLRVAAVVAVVVFTVDDAAQRIVEQVNELWRLIATIGRDGIDGVGVAR